MKKSCFAKKKLVCSPTIEKTNCNADEIGSKEEIITDIVKKNIKKRQPRPKTRLETVDVTEWKVSDVTEWIQCITLRFYFLF